MNNDATTHRDGATTAHARNEITASFRTLIDSAIERDDFGMLVETMCAAVRALSSINDDGCATVYINVIAVKGFGDGAVDSSHQVSPDNGMIYDVTEIAGTIIERNLSTKQIVNIF